MLKSLKFCAALALCLATASSPALAQPQRPDANARDVTDVTVFLRRDANVPLDNIRINPGSASSCNFFGTSAMDSDYARDYMARFGGDPSRGYAGSGYFSAYSPYGDASRDPYGMSSPYGNPNTYGSRGIYDYNDGSRCSQSDYNFAAGRAYIRARDRTLTDAFALFDQKKYPEALDMFQKSYKKIGYAEAALMTGRMYLLGLGTKADTPKALEWLHKAAEQPNPPRTLRFDAKAPERMDAATEASIVLAKIYLIGHGVDKNPATALKWYQKAASRAYVPAYKTVGDFYYYGFGVKKDVVRASRNYKTAAENGFAPAQIAMAQILASGDDGVPANPKTSLGWYYHAAKANHPDGLYALAVAYDKGQGVKADPKQALYYYKEAAVRGNPAAQNDIGTYFAKGDTILPKDEAIARKWFEVSAKNGEPEAMYNLAVLLMKGQGGPVDRKSAWLWFTVAQKAGHPNAEAALKQLEPQMTAAEKAEAAAVLAPKS
ncbi:hypothetical protein PQU92_05725 [Asticcacaulis sp. BYS171W]|uniref:Sel1 repeat family protein n=1 Tax=Asticcacaulis aquaticus TaxID=2984212 RepID=A0ABT5HRR9_9CAUL|nr:SEL1-like repeat protein [Asticcacaulis aquaticus]MDC7682766.1 hypothetical protein [Asticcacaulis aquaticus]